MTRKHFEALAEALRSTNASVQTCKAVFEVCRAHNPRADRARFLAACGLSHEQCATPGGLSYWRRAFLVEDTKP